VFEEVESQIWYDGGEFDFSFQDVFFVDFFVGVAERQKPGKHPI
jgi:hypothetical protein